jgi:hypothetical protein
MSSIATRPTTAHDLSTLERTFALILQKLGGRLETVRNHGGAVVLEPWPTGLMVLKFGAAETQSPSPASSFELKSSLANLFEYIRGVDDGEIRCLEVRHGLPFSIEVE